MGASGAGCGPPTARFRMHCGVFTTGRRRAAVEHGRVDDEPDGRPAPAAQGEAQRELVRVPVECCLQERAWNPYYGHLLGRLAAAAKGHRITLQFCLWDHFKQARARQRPGA